MSKAKLRIAELSDIHLGHHRTPTAHILQSLRLAFPDNPKTAEIDIIYIAGDLFDKLVNLPNHDVFLINNWIVKFLKICKKHNIQVRILEGTPSHDWKQPQLFVNLNEVTDINADVKYFQELSIEYNEVHDIHVLYIPDEWRPHCHQTQAEVKALLQAHNLEQVDYAIMHGCFPHQMPSHLADKLEFHDPQYYLSITKGLIFIGHVHFQSQKDRILSAGSFDRLTHGEEANKGHYRVTAYEDGTHEIDFIVNKNALLYLTWDVSALSAQEAHDLIEEKIKKVPKDSHIRIRLTRDHPFYGNIPALKALYPDYYWTVKDTPLVTKELPLLLDKRTRINTTSLNPSNLNALLLERIEQKSPELTEHCELLLSELTT